MNQHVIINAPIANATAGDKFEIWDNHPERIIQIWMTPGPGNTARFYGNHYWELHYGEWLNTTGHHLLSIEDLKWFGVSLSVVAREQVPPDSGDKV